MRSKADTAAQILDHANPNGWPICGIGTYLTVQGLPNEHVPAYRPLPYPHLWHGEYFQFSDGSIYVPDLQQHYPTVDAYLEQDDYSPLLTAAYS